MAPAPGAGKLGTGGAGGDDEAGAFAIAAAWKFIGLRPPRGVGIGELRREPPGVRAGPKVPVRPVTWTVTSGGELFPTARAASSRGPADTPSEEETDICSVLVAFGEAVIEVLMDVPEESISKESVEDIFG